MSPSHAQIRSTSRHLRGLGLDFLLSELGSCEECPTELEIADLSRSAWSELDATTQHHLHECPRCAHTFAAFRGVRCSEVLPDEWGVVLNVPTTDSTSSGSVSIRGRISLESREFEPCHDDFDWIRSPLHARVAVDVNNDGLLFISVHDLPSTIQSIEFGTPAGAYDLASVAGGEVFELIECFPKTTASAESSPWSNRFRNWLESGRLRLLIHTNPASPARVRALLEEAGAFEREFDYELPSGLHSDVHVNVGSVCHREEYLARLAAAFDVAFSDVEFDTIVANGWAMAMVARRIAERREESNTTHAIRESVCEGYDQLSFSTDVLPGSCVLVLTDVNVTGGLCERMREAVHDLGARVVGIGAVVEPLASASEGTTTVRALCGIPMRLDDPTSGSCPRCDLLEPRVFNPVSCSMTQRAPFPRSPTEFLAQDESARRFWRYVNLTESYEHHHKDEASGTHYIAFVDTRRMLEHDEVGQEIADLLRDRILERRDSPRIVLIPNRVRARVLATMLIDSFREAAPGPELVCVTAKKQPRRRGQRLHGSRTLWRLSDDDVDTVRGTDVLVVDAAAGDGTTVDNLTRLAQVSGAVSVGAVVLLSRLRAGCESAFDNRLSGGFHCLFRLPVRPVVVRGMDESLCPVCRKRMAVRQVGEHAGVDAVKQWAERVQYRGRRRTAEDGPRRVRETQLRLFEDDDFLRTCRQSVASGVTLHALGAARTNGMAPLTLPEIRNDRIPARNRTAMVENLPQSAVEWSGEVLTHDLVEVLRNETAVNVWRASADLLARHGSDDWLNFVDGLGQRLRSLKARTSESFWNHLACTAYLAGSTGPEARSIVRSRFEALAREVEGTEYARGVQVVLDTLTE